MNYRRANNILVVLIVCVCSYILLAPMIPGTLYWWQSHHTSQRQQLQQQISRPSSLPPARQAEPNRLVIPDMLLNAPIFDGTVATQYRTLSRGIWRYPRTSQPGQQGNTVLIGHRFTYTNPRGVFYNLDKVKLGSVIGVYWGGKLYRYNVSNITVVPPTDLSVQSQTNDTRLTIYTCTPLWHPVNRLVVVATPESNL